MGYRSEVAIKCEEKAYEMFINALKKVNEAPDRIYVYEVDGYKEYLLKWDWVKWHEGFGYKDVDAVTDVMNALDEYDDQDTGYGYKFLRLGEDDTDVESRTNNYEVELYFIREIEIPDGMVEMKGE